MFDNLGGKITNSNLEMAGLLLLWLCFEATVPDLAHKHIALFGDNLPTVSWVDKMALKKSQIAAQLVRALALCLNIRKTCSLTPVHIPGIENTLTDIPLCSFGSVKEWEGKTNEDLPTLFNKKFPLPNQVSWTCFQFNTRVSMRMISALQMKGITLAEWQQLPKIGRHIGQTGQNMSDLWGWTLSYRGCGTRQSACPHRVCSMGPARILRKGKAPRDWNSHWRSHGRWTGGRVGLWRQPYQSDRKQKAPPMTLPNLLWMAKRGFTNNQTIPH